MNGGIEMLMARMDTHPEEFIEGSKWGRLIQELHKYAEKEESQALNNKLKQIMMQHLTEQIMEELVDPKSETNPYLMSNTATGGQTLAHSITQQQARITQQAQMQANQAHQAHVALHQQALGALGVGSTTQTSQLGYGAGATSLLKNIFGGKK